VKKKNKKPFVFEGYTWAQTPSRVFFQTWKDSDWMFDYAFFGEPDPMDGWLKFGRFKRKKYRITVEQI
jgi:hypothetical protein